MVRVQRDALLRQPTWQMQREGCPDALHEQPEQLSTPIQPATVLMNYDSMHTSLASTNATELSVDHPGFLAK